jgi:hypothetical protein
VQMQSMSKMMKLGANGGMGDEETMKEMLKQKGKVKPGSARRKKSSLPAARGFGARA